MTGGAQILRGLWLSYWKTRRAYHRYEVRGLEQLTAGPRPALVVGYHGRPFAHDLCMLQSLLLERTGDLPLAIVHDSLTRAPGLGHLLEGLGLVGPAEAAAGDREHPGRSLLVTPGGTREGCRDFRRLYQVDWGERLGYLRLAVTRQLPIVPTAAAGTDEAYLGLVDGYRLGKRWRLPGKLSPFLGLGPLGPWPFTPPFPVKIVQHVGPPITDHLEEPPDGDPEREERRLRAADRRVRRAVQGLLERRGDA